MLGAASPLTPFNHPTGRPPTPHQGYLANTGTVTPSRIDITGVGGRKLVDKWANGPTAWLGLMVSGFPNLLMIHGPLTPGAQAQMPTVGEWQVNFVADIVAALDRDGYARIDTTEEAER
jgi:cyclohexanone monooxygenase